MATQDDQPRPDLDAAIDAVVPSLTAVSEQAAADSLRRVRLALADDVPARASVGAWRWAGATVAIAGALLVVAFSRQWSPVEPTRVARVDEVPRAARLLPRSSPASPGPTVTPPAPAAPGRTPRATPPRVRAASVPAASASAAPSTAPRPDPLVALQRAVQQIPEETWTAALAGARAPVATPDVSLAPIVLAPLETPPILDTLAEPLAPGEP